MLGQDAWRSDEETWEGIEPKKKTIADETLNETERLPFARFLAVFVLGVAFFVLPIPWEGAITVPFDIFVTFIENSAAQYVHDRRCSRHDDHCRESSPWPLSVRR